MTATLVDSANRRWSPAPDRISPWMVVVGSRLIVLGAGIFGALNGTWQAGWALFDPSHVSSSLGSLGNVLAATVVRWDSIHYLQIAEHGYRTAGDTIFFPMYPLLMHVVASVVGSEVVAGVVISGVAFAVALVLLHRLTNEELGRHAADATLILLALAPVSFFFTAIYTESLFLSLSVGTFYLARKQRFFWASLTASIATLTRVPGVLLAVPVAVMYLQTHGIGLRRGPKLGSDKLKVTMTVLPVLALCGLCAYFHAHGYGWLAPLRNQTNSVHGHSLSGPLVTLEQALVAAGAGTASMLSGVPPIEPSLGGPFSVGFQNVVCLLVLGICVAALIASWGLLPKAYAIYAALALIICIWSPVPVMPLRSIDRYALVIFPLWMAAGAKSSEHRLTTPVALLGAVLLVFYAYQAGRWVFIA